MAVLLVMIQVVGEARGWDAASPHLHNESATSAIRFLPKPYGPDDGAKGRWVMRLPMGDNWRRSCDPTSVHRDKVAKVAPL